MKCKDCDACHKGYFQSKPDDYVCIGVYEPFVIENIDKECTEYPEKNKDNTPMIVEKSWEEFRDSGFLWWSTYFWMGNNNKNGRWQNN